MNPTAKNISSKKSWGGIRAPWIGVKNAWKLFNSLGFIDDKTFSRISKISSVGWSEEFAKETYSNISKNSIYITNLSKSTQLDARPLSDSIFRNYLELFKKEIGILKPRIIITFGNQVSSIIIGKKIAVSKYRKKCEEININGFDYLVFPVFYPVGQGTRNMPIARDDIKWILKNKLPY